MTPESKKPERRTPEGNRESWQSQLASPEERLASLLQCNRLTDLTITFPGHKRVMKAHRLVLAMSSPVFEAMLFGPLAELQGRVLHLQDESPEAFKCLMQYMYLGRIALPGVGVAVEVLRLSRRYQMAGLFSFISQFLQINLNLYNLPEIYDVALHVSDTPLISKCSQFVRKSPTHLLTSNVRFLSRRVLAHIMAQPINITEVEKFAAVLTWGRSQLEARQMKESPENLRRAIGDFLPQMEILTMKPDDFVDCVAPTGIFTRDENMAILLNIKRVPGVPLPSACVKTSKKALQDERQLKCVHFDFNRHARQGSIRVHSHQDQTLLANLKASKPVQLKRVFCDHIAFHEATATVRGACGLVQQTVTSEGPDGFFPTPVTLRPGMSCTITVKTKGFCCPLLHSFSLWHDGIRFEGQRPFLKAKGPMLYFWSLEDTPE
ncbi:BTB/POZ domain-containing protein 6 [Penaeus vannamei]|uniref:BTB/POZ domain-containing protein 6 n=1 Tax=Penaeus vannamei TaxID=6689 RepID=UPI00387F4866